MAFPVMCTRRLLSFASKRHISSLKLSAARTLSIGAFLSSSHLLQDDVSIVALAKKVTSLIDTGNKKSELLSKLNLSEDAIKAFETISNCHDDSSLCNEAVANLKKFFNEESLGILEEVMSGTVEEDSPLTATMTCCGCGARLQCSNREKPGFISNEQLKLPKNILQHTKCRRCSVIHTYDVALTTTVKPSTFKKVVAKSIKLNKKSSVLLMVDLTDYSEKISFQLFDGIMHPKTDIILIGNKFDLIPPDSIDYEERIKQVLKEASFVLKREIRDVHLVSAKTGYGIEGLVSSIQRIWESKRDVYLVGAANAGKSTLFNALIDSDLCSAQATELHQKATVSKWPGTTLNTLKFPLEHISPARQGSRSNRLFKERTLAERGIVVVKSDGYVSGQVSRSFAFGMSELREGEHYRSPFEIDFAPPNIRSTSEAWFYDTPGITNDNSMLPVLNKNELSDVMPTQAYRPRIFSLNPNDCLTFGGIGRIEYLEGFDEIYLFVFSSNVIPVVIATIEQTNKYFPNWVDSGKLQVPKSMERHKELGSYHSVDIRLKSQEEFCAITDVVFASAGWITVVMKDCWSNGSIRASCLCVPPYQRKPLLADVNRLKGKRHGNSPEYVLRKDFDKIFTIGKKLLKQQKRNRPRKNPVSEDGFQELTSDIKIEL